MQIASTGRMVSQINMTPMIDVLLVLIIICLVVLPGHTTGLPASVPEESPSRQQQVTDLETLVVSVSAGPKYEVNGHPVPPAELGAMLQRTLTERHNKDLFIRGAKELEYLEIARVIDIARGAGSSRIGLLNR